MENTIQLIVPKKGYTIPFMGTNKTSVGEVLFTKTQQRVLGLLFGNPDRSFYANEIVRHAGVGIGSVQRELERLESVQLLTSTRVGNQKHYQANRQAPIFAELCGIVLKTFGVADHLRQALAPLQQHILLAFIYGSVANSTDKALSDIDLMIISDSLDYRDLLQHLVPVEGETQRPINPNIYKREEWQRKSADKDGFISRVLKQPKILLIGNESDLVEAGKPSQDR
ncbi:MAG: nucleotidyltransferase domain-containing protein [Xanthomonadales bacterium]|nr:nucleotidyltransferase domain-containing protein [Xanthomonadales bacterium]